MDPPDKEGEQGEVRSASSTASFEIPASTSSSDDSAPSSVKLETSASEPTLHDQSRASAPSTPKKSPEVQVPAPISTSIRRVSSARPASVSFAPGTSPVKSQSITTSEGAKKWVVNVTAPLQGFSTSPSPSARTSDRSSMRLDAPLILHISETATTTPTTSSPGSISRVTSDPSLSSSDSPTTSTLTNGESPGSAKSKPPVPVKSAAMLESRRQGKISARSVSVHYRAPPPIPKRASAFFDATSYQKGATDTELAEYEHSEHSTKHHRHKHSAHPPASDSSDALSSDEITKLRANLAGELCKTEQFYVRSLKTIVSSYLTPMRASLQTDDPILSLEQQKFLFSNVEVLVGIHQTFLVELETIVSEWSLSSSKLGPALLNLAPILKVYTQYINNYNNSMTTYEEAMKHKSFRKFMTEAAVGNELDNWPSYCIQPVQRIPKYLLILSELVKNTQPEHSDYKSLKGAFDAFSSMANEINVQKREAENLTQCATIQGMLSYSDGSKIEIVNPRRRYCREGTYEVFLNGVSTVFNYLVLFNDALLITKSKKKQLRFDGWLLLSHCLITTSLEDDEYEGNPSSPSASTVSLPAEVESSTPAAESSSVSPATSPSRASVLLSGSTANLSSVSTSASTSLYFKSLVMPLVMEVKFPTSEEMLLWKNDCLPGAAKPDAVMPETFPDRIISIEAQLSALSEDGGAVSPRGKSASLGSGRSRNKLRRLFSTSKSSKSRDQSISSNSMDPKQREALRASLLDGAPLKSPRNADAESTGEAHGDKKDGGPTSMELPATAMKRNASEKNLSTRDRISSTQLSPRAGSSFTSGTSPKSTSPRSHNTTDDTQASDE